MVTDIKGISFAQFFDMMEICGPGSAVLLEGDTGIGKTTICEYFAKNIVHLDLHTIQVSEGSDMVDVFGLPDFDSGRTVYKPPSWYPGPDKPCVLLLDEVNRNRNIMKGLMRLATDMRIGDLTLAPGSYVMGAINPEYGQLYQVVEMDPAHRARFQVIQLEPTVEEWLAFARREGLHEALLEYIRRHPNDLDTFKNDKNVQDSKGQFYHHVLPCRRQVHKLALHLKNGENFKNSGLSRFDPEHYPDAENFLYALVAGRVGVGFAERFTMFYYSYKNMMPPERVLMPASKTAWDANGELTLKIKDMTEHDVAGLSLLGEEIMDYLAANEKVLWNEKHDGPSDTAKKYATNLFKFMALCPPEIVSSLYHLKIRPALREADFRKEQAQQGKGRDDGPKWEKLITIAVPKLLTLIRSAAKEE